MKIELELKIESVSDAIRTAGLAVVGMALYQELRKPPAARTWRGEVLGAIPYDFRPPTLERIRDTYWNPDNPNLFVPMAFGVGWTVNLPVLLRDAQRLAQDAMSEARTRLQARR